jgi:hypothetical protein
MTSRLINILAPEDLIQKFDATATALSMTRTRAILNLMEGFVVDRVVDIERINQQLTRVQASLDRHRKFMEERGFMPTVAKQIGKYPSTDADAEPVGLYRSDGLEIDGEWSF